MDLYLNKELAAKYRSKSQIARVLTEAWISDNMYCPRCGNDKIEHFPNNKKVADFFCPKCGSEYELKSKSGSMGRKIANGAYDTFVQRITSNTSPDFLILNYSMEKLYIRNLWFIPKHFFVPNIVEKRKPLPNTARRAGWIGCNIYFDKIPKQGQIGIICNRIPIAKDDVIAQVQDMSFFDTDNISTRSWIVDILYCINKIPKTMFSLEDVYQFESWLASQHPANHNIRPKVRQQLQILRDNNIIEFLGNGLYKKL